jgi:hypothetical protein
MKIGDFHEKHKLLFQGANLITLVTNNPVRKQENDSASPIYCDSANGRDWCSDMEDRGAVGA